MFQCTDCYVYFSGTGAFGCFNGLGGMACKWIRWISVFHLTLGVSVPQYVN